MKTLKNIISNGNIKTEQAEFLPLITLEDFWTADFRCAFVELVKTTKHYAFFAFYNEKNNQLEDCFYVAKSYLEATFKVGDFFDFDFIECPVDRAHGINPSFITENNETKKEKRTIIY